LEEYPHLPYWFTLRQAVAEIRAYQIEVQGRMSLPRYLLVFDEKYRLLGYVRRRDILRGLEPSFVKGPPSEYRKKLFDVEFDPNLLEVMTEQWLAHIRERAEKSISDVMLPIEVTVSAEDHILKIIHEMVVHDMSMLPVLRDSKVVGVVRTVEVFHQISEMVL
jgi:CBS-domain-containing membrane protein